MESLGFSCHPEIRQLIASRGGMLWQVRLLKGPKESGQGG
jgi:hypothetical protein